MPQPVRLSLDRSIRVAAAPLTAESFAPFGDVIANPRPGVLPSHLHATPGLDAVLANQGSAIKYRHVSRPQNLCDSAPSRRAGTPEMNLFSCAARALRWGDTLPVSVLERHPFTTQTFVPLAARHAGARYLVVVAPSLPPSDADAGLPVPPTSALGGEAEERQMTDPLPGRGLPDLRRLRAFVADGTQAVTYGAGTWHAPMVALAPLDFVVVQFTTGVDVEDCQEAEIGGPASVSVQVPRPLMRKAKL